jgi:cytidylate kinase
MPDLTPVLTIDGPSGSGKGTISKLLAEHLGWHLLDSGALYRVLALQVLHDNCSFDDIDRIETLAGSLDAEFSDNAAYLNGSAVTQEIRNEACGDVASRIAAYPSVRAALLARQKLFAQPPGLVADGRDMGTVVFPDAFLKIYLDASVEERAKRRFLQLKESGYNVTLQDLIADIMQRDVRDKTRAVAPLEPASDAILLDCTDIGIEAVFKTIANLVKQRLSNI